MKLPIDSAMFSKFRPIDGSFAEDQRLKLLWRKHLSPSRLQHLRKALRKQPLQFKLKGFLPIGTQGPYPLKGIKIMFIGSENGKSRTSIDINLLGAVVHSLFMSSHASW